MNNSIITFAIPAVLPESAEEKQELLEKSLEVIHADLYKALPEGLQLVFFGALLSSSAMTCLALAGGDWMRDALRQIGEMVEQADGSPGLGEVPAPTAPSTQTTQ